MKVVSGISLNENFQASEFYLSDQKLFVLGNMQNTQVDSDSKTLYRGSCTRIQTYDLADINNPKSIGTVDQSGYYRTSRFKTDICMYSATIIFTIRSPRKIILPMFRLLATIF
mgnify:CR=1 FL=1